MKFTLAAAGALFATALASPIARSDDTTYQIKGFTLRKYDGVDISTVSFTIAATNGDCPDFECSPHDKSTGAAAAGFESDTVYSCGENSDFSFKYIPAHDLQTNELYLYQDVSATEQLQGSAFLDDPPCSAGASTPEDLVCTVSPEKYFAITLKETEVA